MNKISKRERKSRSRSTEFARTWADPELAVKRKDELIAFVDQMFSALKLCNKILDEENRRLRGKLGYKIVYPEKYTGCCLVW